MRNGGHFSYKRNLRYIPIKFTVYTDHMNLQELFNRAKDFRAGKLYRWALRLQDLTFEALYLPGKDNVFADYLSRDMLPKDAHPITDINTFTNPKPQQRQEDVMCMQFVKFLACDAKDDNIQLRSYHKPQEDWHPDILTLYTEHFIEELVKQPKPSTWNFPGIQEPLLPNDVRVVLPLHTKTRHQMNSDGLSNLPQLSPIPLKMPTEMPEPDNDAVDASGFTDIESEHSDLDETEVIPKRPLIGFNRWQKGDYTAFDDPEYHTHESHDVPLVRRYQQDRAVKASKSNKRAYIYVPGTNGAYRCTTGKSNIY